MPWQKMKLITNLIRRFPEISNSVDPLFKFVGTVTYR
jgi:hypothetical protein